MSNWELVPAGEESQRSEAVPQESGWELVPSHEQQPSFGTALMQAPGKIAEDVYGGINNLAGKVPEFLRQFPQKSTQALIASRMQPLSSSAQMGAGAFEGARNFLNMPSDISNYLSERLNLVPQGANQFIQQRGHIPEMTQDINSIFGSPQNAGQETLRSGASNAFNMGLGSKGLTGLNNLRPGEFMKNKSGAIRNEYQAAKALEKETFAKVFDQYGDNKITVNPTNYLGKMGIERKRLMHDAKIAYDDVLKNPTLNNVHKLQSQINSDANKVFENYPNKYQAYREYKNKLMDDTQSYLGKIDENALNNYNLGRQITRDVVSPYTSSTLLQQVAKGVYPDVSAHELSSAIHKGKRDIIYEREGKPVTAIHETHPLINHLSDIESRLRNYKLMKYGLGAGVIGSGALGGANKLNQMYMQD